MEKHSTMIDGRRYIWHTERLWELACRTSASLTSLSMDALQPTDDR